MEKTVTLPLMASQSTGMCLLSLLAQVVYCKCVFRRPKLATYHKGKAEQTLNICFLFSYGVVILGHIFPFVS